MITLLMIADDFTGALDTGVQFAAAGAETRVVVGARRQLASTDPEVRVLVVDAETRHMTPEKAAAAVAELTRQAVELGIPYLYKKTDSALRGNVGAELAALLEASGSRQLPFLPAYPQAGRTTVGGVHQIDGVPVAQSVFGQDPFEPVRCSKVAELIGEQSDVPVHLNPPLSDQAPIPDDEGILVFDGQTPEDLETTGRRLLEAGRLHIMAGCAGFGGVLPALLGLASEHPRAIPPLEGRLLVVCGSVNPISVAQMDQAERLGIPRWHLTPEQKLRPDYWQTQEGEEVFHSLQQEIAQDTALPYILDTNDKEGNHLTAQYAQSRGLDIHDIRLGVSRSVGHLVGGLFTNPHVGTLLITGGDTLLQCMEHMGVDEVEPVCELSTGVVLSRVTYQGCTRCVLTKSGGFGGENLVTDLARQIVPAAKH